MSIDAVAERLGVSAQELVDAIVELADGKLSVLDHVHGTWPAYKSGCRCESCRDLPSRSVKDATPHGISRWKIGCRCKVCTKAHSAARKTSERKAQRRTEETASRRGYEWTGPELEIAARPDLTAQQVALMLGRTFKGVRRMRERLRNDPKIKHLAGAVYPSIGTLPQRGLCHCGEPIHVYEDGFTRDLCEHCSTVRCDTWDGDCGRGRRTA